MQDADGKDSSLEQERVRKAKQELVRGLPSTLSWHRYHREQRAWNACAVEGEGEAVAALEIVARLVDPRFKDEVPVPMLVERLERVLTWHRGHLASGCSFKTQGEGGHVEFLLDILHRLTWEDRFLDELVGTMREQLAESHPELERRIPE